MNYPTQNQILIILTGIITVIAVIGVITLQLLAAAVTIVLIVAGALLVKFLKRHMDVQKELPGEGEAVVAGILFAIVGMAVSQWLLWAVALAVLFMILQAVLRIESRLNALENR
jgi:heme A synthase